MRRYADANVFLRYLLGDIPAQAEAAREAIMGGVWLADAVLAEVVYVLGGVYGMPRRELVDLLLQLLDEVNGENKEIFVNALNLYGAKKKLDFVDCLLAARKKIVGDDILTFDRDLIKELTCNA